MRIVGRQIGGSNASFEEMRQKNEGAGFSFTISCRVAGSTTEMSTWKKMTNMFCFATGI